MIDNKINSFKGKTSVFGEDEYYSVLKNTANEILGQDIDLDLDSSDFKIKAPRWAINGYCNEEMDNEKLQKRRTRLKNKLKAKKNK
mgnify:CR=1 FL=1